MKKVCCVLLALCLVACGQTGPLYLPDKTPPAKQQTKAPGV